MIKFHRILPVSVLAKPGDTRSNAEAILKEYQRGVSQKAAVVATQELSLTGYTCGDLFLQDELLQAARRELLGLVERTAGHNTILLVGLPLADKARVYDVVAVIQSGTILGFVGKNIIGNFPGSGEERRFSSIGELGTDEIEFEGKYIPCGNRMVFDGGCGLVFGVEIGADADGVVPLSSDLALAGAVMIFNPTAVPMTSEHGLRLISSCEENSRRLRCAYATINAPEEESTSDWVFDGCLTMKSCFDGFGVWGNHHFCLLRGTDCLDGGVICTSWIQNMRRRDGIFKAFGMSSDIELISAQEVPAAGIADMNGEALNAAPWRWFYHCSDIIDDAARALAGRVKSTCSRRLVLGISGGLDSAMALLICARCCDLLGKERNFVLAVTMPGMGTTARTKNNAVELVKLLGAELREISIKQSVLQHFKDIGHNENVVDVTYENAQARERTQILMDLANMEGGLVVGTGDMSEIALGWSTFNGDHMSMYCVNGNLPKTVIRNLLRSDNVIDVVDEYFDGNAKIVKVLRDIVDTPVSPELMPGGKQNTENIIGDYEIIDFCLYYFLKFGETQEHILELAKAAFKDKKSLKKITMAVNTFFQRFYVQQFKRNAAPDAPVLLDLALNLNSKTGWVMGSDVQPGK